MDPEGPTYWKTFQRHVANLIIEALLLLRQRDDLVKDEVELSRLLFLCLGNANRHFGLPLPAYDGRNPPHPEDKKKAKREDNRPDIYWTLMDYETDCQDWYRIFALECKRLGKKTDAGWIFNEHYVIDGILRFFLEEKGYGKGCETGAMVGYVQDMEFNDILREVNSYLTSHASSLSTLVEPVNGWQSQGVSHFSHTFNRSYIPSPFSLQHFWIDIKDCVYLPSVSKASELPIEEESVLSDSKNEMQHIRKDGRKSASKMRKPKIIFKESFQEE